MTITQNTTTKIFKHDDGGETIKVYDENGKLLFMKLASGFWIRYEYDENGNETYRENSQGIKKGKL